MRGGQPRLKLSVFAKSQLQGFGDDVLLRAVQELGVVFQQGGHVLRDLACERDPGGRFDLSRNDRHTTALLVRFWRTWMRAALLHASGLVHKRLVLTEVGNREAEGIDGNA